MKSLKYFIENFIFWLLLNHSHHIKEWLAPIQELLDIVCTVVNSMVGYSVLWKVVGSNLLRTRGSSNLNFTKSLTLLQLFVKLYLVKAARKKVNSESTFNWMGCKNLHVMLEVKNIYMDVWNVAQQSLEICFTVLGWLSCSELYLNVEIFLSDSQL